MGVIKKVYAHCDVPCGIYETDTARHAADTCLRMVEKYADLGGTSDPEHHNQAIRIVMYKEEHAMKCKNQLQMLWSDYFKPEHLDQFPDLHEKFWMATKQCGRVKQTMSIEECQKLIDMVADISGMFASTK
ncbi:MAG: superoxide dismutase, Ni [Patescibacteria group bacterium]